MKTVLFQKNFVFNTTLPFRQFSFVVSTIYYLPFQSNSSSFSKAFLVEAISSFFYQTLPFDHFPLNISSFDTIQN